MIALKKLILGLLIVGSGAWAEFEVKMNTKALYKDSFEKLSTSQQNYILDNMDTIRSITETILKRETVALKKEKNFNDKNVVELMIDKDGKTKEIKFLNRSDERRFDNITKKVLEEAVKNYPKPSEPTPIRMVMIYENGSITLLSNQRHEKVKETNTNYIQRGTTRFEYSMGEQMREFETSKDGFINVNTSPGWCANLQILTENNQRIQTGMFTHYPSINKEIPKGKYKLLVITKETCNVNIQYP